MGACPLRASLYSYHKAEQRTCCTGVPGAAIVYYCARHTNHTATSKNARNVLSRRNSGAIKPTVCVCACNRNTINMALGRRRRVIAVRPPKLLALAPLALAVTLTGVTGGSVGHVASAARGPPLALQNSVRNWFTIPSNREYHTIIIVRLSTTDCTVCR